MKCCPRCRGRRYVGWRWLTDPGLTRLDRRQSIVCGHCGGSGSTRTIPVEDLAVEPRRFANAYHEAVVYRATLQQFAGSLARAFLASRVEPPA